MGISFFSGVGGKNRIGAGSLGEKFGNIQVCSRALGKKLISARKRECGALGKIFEDIKKY